MGAGLESPKAKPTLLTPGRHWDAKHVDLMLVNMMTATLAYLGSADMLSMSLVHRL